jgi:hypothetical protein
MAAAVHPQEDSWYLISVIGSVIMAKSVDTINI